MYVQRRGYVAYGNVDALAYRHRVMVNSTPGLPQDTFERPRVWTSRVDATPAPAWKRWVKGLGEAFTQSASIAKLVAIFYPPAAPVAAVGETFSPVVSLATSQIDTRPIPVKMATRTPYNPWFM